MLDLDANTYEISIHAPREGSDDKLDKVTEVLKYFNPRSP